MSTRQRIVSATFIVCSFALSVASAGAVGLPVPVPVPPIPTVKQATQDVVSKALVKSMGEFFFTNQPLRISAEAQYPTVSTLPGSAFAPVNQDVVKRLYAQAHDGRVTFPAGDYEVSVWNYCMLAHVHVPTRNKFRLTPIQGAWSDISAALFARTSYGYNPHDVQILTWSLLAGMKYSEMTPASRHLVDAVLPEFKPRLQMSFYEQLQHYWAKISSNVPGVPSFDAALGQMGDVGKSIITLRDIRDQIIANAADFDRISRDFATIGVGRIPSDVAPTPWSIIQSGVYARLLNKAGYMSPGVLEIRVTPQAVAAQGMRVASVGRAPYVRTSPADVAFLGIPLPTTGWAGFPGAAVQALGWNPKPGDQPPGSNGGGGGNNSGGGGPPPAGQAPGNGGPPPGGQPPGNGDQPPGDQGGGGGGGGNNGSGPKPGKGGGDDEGDASGPCDPPDNMFGVDKGTNNGDSPTGMDLGRGKGHGIVCLLLRPFISLAPLGWSTRPGGQIDDGSVVTSLPGHPQTGHIVVIAHYTYATTSTTTQLYVKKHITAVIDYAGVNGFCPELSQTIALHGLTPVPGWLSGAELENRLCISGMAGQGIQVKAWVVDGDTVGPTLTHEVDPTNFLYADFWGHM